MKTSFKLKANPLKKPQTADEWEPYLADSTRPTCYLPPTTYYLPSPSPAACGLSPVEVQLAEAEISAHVYKLFDLTPTEIALLPARSRTLKCGSSEGEAFGSTSRVRSYKTRSRYQPRTFCCDRRYGPVPVSAVRFSSYQWPQSSLWGGSKGTQLISLRVRAGAGSFRQSGGGLPRVSGANQMITAATKYTTTMHELSLNQLGNALKTSFKLKARSIPIQVRSLPRWLRSFLLFRLQ